MSGDSSDDEEYECSVRPVAQGFSKISIKSTEPKRKAAGVIPSTTTTTTTRSLTHDSKSCEICKLVNKN
jgi:hypothetical protein